MTRFYSAFIVFLIISQITNAQEIRLFGVNNLGGSSNTGNIISMKLDGTDLQTEYNFEGIGVSGPTSELLLASDGKFYGTANNGGEFNSGALFFVNGDGTGYTVIYNFRLDTDGASPVAGLIELTNGRLCGITSFGGENNFGTIFSINKDGSDFQVFYHFDELDGGNPQSSPFQASNGKIYGTTIEGGFEDSGVLYSINPDGTGYEVVHFFDRFNQGARGFGQLMEDSNGILYGTLSEGGPFQAGGVFQINLDGTGFNVLQSFSFDTASSPSPLGGLVMASNGRLYGTSANGGLEFKGTVFSINPDGSDYEIVHEFIGDEGSIPLFGLELVEIDSTLYGTSFSGGTNGNGTIYKVGLDGNGFTKLFDFQESTGAGPIAGMTLGADGLLYGLTNRDGGTRGGTLYRIDTEGVLFEILHDFSQENGNGAGPISKLILVDNWAYGTTRAGGENGLGSIYRMDPQSGSFEFITSYNESSGYFTADRLLYASDGWLYGTTTSGGTEDEGTIFRFLPGNDEIETLYHFTPNVEDGASTSAGLLEASNGLMYGVSRSGGEFGLGSIFSFDPLTQVYTQLFSFNPDGSGFGADDALIEGSDGLLYGVNPFAGNNNITDFPRGTLFSIEKDGSNYTVIKQFDNDLDGFPGGPVLELEDGVLYGSIGNGANLLEGGLYRISTDGNNFEIIHTFTPETGITPRDELLYEASTEWLYGFCTRGGNDGAGTIFRLNPVDLTFEKLADMGGFPEGNQPIGGLMAFELPSFSKDKESLSGITVGPNPSNGNFNLIFENDFPLQDNAQVNIVDETGKSIFNFNGNILTANYMLRATSHNWNSGNYFLEIKMDGKYFSETLMILKR